MATGRATPISTSHEVVRLDIGVAADYEAFCRRFESAVPAFDVKRATALIERRASWPEIVAITRVGVELDRKLAELLAALEVAVPEALCQ